MAKSRRSDEYAALKEYEKEQRAEDRRAAIEVSTCACGWNGKVQPGAKGQRCPNCGESLT